VALTNHNSISVKKSKILKNKMDINLVSIEGFVACISLAIIVIQLLASIFVGGDSDIDVDGDGDFDLSGLFTPKGILQFICGFAWYLVLIKASRGSFLWYDWLIGAGIGLVLMICMALLYYGISKLSHENKFEKGEDLVGKSGTITSRNTDIPGIYWMMISRDGTQSEIKVKSKSGNGNLRSGDQAQIVAFEDETYFIN
jgi:hypothetical protein